MTMRRTVDGLMKGKKINMFEEILLPNGKVAQNASDVDAFLKENDLAISGDFSGSYMKNVSRRKQALQRQNAFEDFINEYKRRIWNE